MKRYDGFSLIEMIVVMMIVAILCLLSLPNISQVIHSANEKGCQALSKVVETARLHYQLDHDGKVPSLDDLVAENYISSKQTTCPDGSPLVLDQTP